MSSTEAIDIERFPKSNLSLYKLRYNSRRLDGHSLNLASPKMVKEK